MVLYYYATFAFCAHLIYETVEYQSGFSWGIIPRLIEYEAV